MNAPLALDDRQAEAVRPVAPGVEEVLNQVQADCQAAPEQYLADTVVPFGGE